MAVSINCPCIFLLSLLYSSPSSPLSMRQRLKRWDVSTLNSLYVRLCCGTASEIRLPENYWCNPNGASEHWLCSTSSSDWAFSLQNNIQSNNQFKQCWETFFLYDWTCMHLPKAYLQESHMHELWPFMCMLGLLNVEDNGLYIK